MSHRNPPGAAVTLALAVATLCAVAALALPGRGEAHPAGLEAARQGTAAFHDLDAASRAGYAELRDAAGIACIDNPGVGAMGVHYVSGAVNDAVLDPAAPEALVYEPRSSGPPRLVAVEYIAFQAVWDAAHAAPPSLFGRELELVGAPNRFGLPAFYELHAWVWKHNPRGMFDDWNPRATCAFG